MVLMLCNCLMMLFICEVSSKYLELFSTYVNPCGSFCVVSQRKGEEIAEEMKDRDREERNRNESEETEEIKTFPLYPYLLQG